MGDTKLWGILENRPGAPAEKPDSKGLDGSGRAMSNGDFSVPKSGF